MLSLPVFAKPAKAQYCGGQGQCCQSTTETRCVVGTHVGIPCENTFACDAQETCLPVTIETCSTDSTCNLLPNSTQCNGYIVGCNGPGDVYHTWTCGWVGGNATPPPSGGGCGSCSDPNQLNSACGGIAQWCIQDPGGTCHLDSCTCGGAGCPPTGNPDPCPTDACPGYCCQAGCGDPCIVTADCVGKAAGVQCLWMNTGKRCVNPVCPNNSAPSGGGACGCTGGLTCGQSCAGGCGGSSVCTFVNTPAGNCNPATGHAVCIGTDPNNGNNTLNPAYDRPRCYSGDTGNNLLRRTSNGATTGFTQADYDATCSCPNPGDIATTVPTDGGTVIVPVGGQATISWSAALNATKYDLELYPQGSDCSDAAAHCTYGASGGGIAGTSYSFTPTTTTAYTFRVRGYFGACGTVGNWTALINFTVLGQITGTVYDDPNGIAGLSGSLCTAVGLSGVSPGANSTISFSPGGLPNAVVQANGSYTGASLFNTGSTLILTPGDATYQCTCPAGCTYGGILSPRAGINFYVSKVGGAWFQAMGGDVNVSGTTALTFKDPINSLCVGACSPFPLIAPSGGTTAQIGALLSFTSASIDVSDQDGNQNSPVGPVGGDYPVKTKSSIACKENYDYFYRLYSMGTNPREDFISPQNDPAGAHKPDLVPVNINADGTNKGAYFRDGDLTINQNWAVDAGESIVVFVNGNLSVTNDAQITMPATGFLAFIVKGSIIFDSTIGTNTPSSTTGTIQGVYIANGGISIQSVGASPATAEKKFVGEGTFVACGSISLPRDFRNSPNAADGVNNNKFPASLFIFRPDIISNTPDKMKHPLQNWQEVAP